MAVFFVCLVVGWDRATTIAAVPFLARAVAFAARVIDRKVHGTAWADAWRADDAGRQVTRLLLRGRSKVVLFDGAVA